MNDELICKEGVKLSIEAQLASYVVPGSAVLGGYIQRSRECTSQYNGRQIFEMLQNVDDQLNSREETERECSITLDKDNGTLVFRNKGKPFTIKGVKSIMYPDSSQKRIEKLDTIGNKGLGFRSLLNWNPREIFIRSNNVELMFSQKVLKEDFLDRNEELCRAMKDAHEDQLPILTFPRVTDWKGSDAGWVTEIELRGIQGAISEIEIELLNFRSELMLFLRHLRQIKIEIISVGQKRETVYKASKPQQILDVSQQLQERVISKLSEGAARETKWLICWDKGELEENGNPTRYNVEVGVPYNGGTEFVTNGVLYNYLPTKVRVKLPCLVHATVKLEDHRNALVTRNGLNAKICSEIIPNVIVRLALAIRDNKLIDDKWLPFSLLAAPTECDDQEYIGKMYCQLLAALKKLEICPCVDGIWRALGDSRYCKPLPLDKCDVSDFFAKHPRLFPNYVCSGMPNRLAEFDCVQIKDSNELMACLNTALLDESKKDTYSIQNLADLICILWQFAQRGMKHSGPYWLLCDDQRRIFDDNKKIVYTPVSADRISLPEYMKADFVSTELWTEITTRFSREIGQFSASEEGEVKTNNERAFCRRVLRDELGLRIEYYDRANVAKQMVSLVRQKLVDTQIDVAGKRDLVRKLFQALLDNYRADNEPRNREDNVPLFVDDTGKVFYANDFLFEKAKDAYGDLIPSSVFLSKERESVLFEGIESVVDHEKFLRYLGVRGDVRVIYKEIKPNAGRSDGYLVFLQEIGVTNGGLPEASHTYDAMKATWKIVGIRDSDLGVLKTMPVSQFFKLFGLELQEGICALIDSEPGDISWNAVNGRENSYNSYVVRWSYVAYQLHERFSGVIFGENDKVLADLDWRFEQNQQGVPASVLLKMGAKSKLADLAPAELYGLVNRVAEIGRRPTKDFYKKINAALTMLDEHKIPVNPPKDLKVYADGYGFRLASSVFYHDNPSHAKLLAQGHPMMYLGSRVGVDKVCRHFGVQKLDESDVAFGERINVERKLQDKFDEYYLGKAALLGLLLCQRRSSTLEDCKREIAGTQIILVRSMKYAYGRNNEPDSQLADFSYLRDPNEGRRVFYLCIGTRSGFAELTRDESRKFYGALAGILCDVVKLSDELLERQFYECFADEEKTRLDLEDAGYLDNVDLTIPVPKNYYARHIAYMRNIADTIFVECLKPAVWRFLSQNRQLQEYYVQYEPVYHSSVEKMLADGGEIAKWCLEQQNTEKDDKELKEEFFQCLERSQWWQDLPSPLPADWKLEQDVYNEWQEPIPSELYPELWNKEIEDPRINSLFYFKDNAKRIAEMLNSNPEESTKPGADKSDQDIRLLNRSQSNITFKRPVISAKNGGLKKGSGLAMTDLKMRNQRKKGDLAERMVEYWLKEAAENKLSISNVERVSGSSHNSSRNDSLHYDIRYIQNGITHYVEVKACDSGVFHISPGELHFAEENPATYHLALVYVDTSEVQIVDDVYQKLSSDVRVPDGWSVSVGK